MLQSDEQLAHAIKIKFGTAPHSPTDTELAKIKLDLKALVNRGITPSFNDWRLIVSKHCPKTGNFAYKGLDNSDLQTLLQLATDKK